MAMSPQEREAFVNAYTRVLITAWSSEDYARKLSDAPAEALREAGVEIPANAQVVLVRTVPDGSNEGNLDVQTELWERGLETGLYELHVPETPQLDTAELSEGDLAGVAAGDVNCCCCPCCCCT